jgi:hypothetical protein
MPVKLRETVKHFLRMCGHAFSGTVHARLDSLQQEINDLSLRVTSVAESQEALLRATIYLVEELKAKGPAAREGTGSPQEDEGGMSDSAS